MLLRLLRTRFWVVLIGSFFLPGVYAAEVFTVVNVNASGPGSLSQAVEDANQRSKEEIKTIVFDIADRGTVHKIDLSTTAILLGWNITIDGYTQPGASPNTLSVGDNAVILIQLDGGGPAVTHSGWLGIEGNDCVIRGLSITGFQSGNLDSRNAAIRFTTIYPEFGRRNRIEGNFIGLEPDGVTLRGNDYGINTSFGTFGVIGGTSPAARNIISGNGTGLLSGGLQTIVGNYFGTDASGLADGYGNDIAYIGAVNVIGGAEPGAGNLITGNRVGIIDYGDNDIRGNLIGPRADGSRGVGNEIGIAASGKTAIGGLNSGEANVIAFNGTGVVVGGSANSILSNLFYGNSSMDIDLTNNMGGKYGLTPNDYGDRDTGANNVQNFPVIVSVIRNPGETVVSGGLNSIAGTPFTLQFYANGPSSRPGQTLLGTQAGVTTNSAGDVAFQFAFPVASSPDEFITATATDPNGNTSEFFPPNGPAELANISTRGHVGLGDNILIGGVILNSDTTERTFLIRALGRSLNINGGLTNPKLEVKTPDGTVVGSNDNWGSAQKQAIIATGLSPSDDEEAAMLIPLPGQSYTAQVSGVNGAMGIATVEIFALGSGSAKEFRNISTRGNVGTGDNVLIGGTIVNGSALQKLIVRAIGPDLAGAGVPNSLQDPALELRDAAGTLLAFNDDWRSEQEQEIIASGLAPQDNRDSAIVITLLPTAYTAIVRGKNGTAGIALVEIYNLN